jgi:hypothetical protein
VIKLKGRLTMGRYLLLVPVIFLLFCSPVLAEDGFKVFLGYSLGGIKSDYTTGPFNYTRDGVYFKDGPQGFVHGPSVEARYEASSLFLRATFDYKFLDQARMTYTVFVIQSYPTYGYWTEKNRGPMHGYAWSAEGNIGYKVYDENRISLIPYIGMGYRNTKATIELIGMEYLPFSGWTEQYYTPYAVAGGLISYSADSWSAGLDASALVPFAGRYKNSLSMRSANLSIGIGARAQLPVTYTIIPKKGNAVGVMAFVTPYYEYLDSGDSKILHLGTVKYNVVERNYGVKVGLGFAF